MIKRIGKYEIQGELGRGGSGRVYRALAPTVGRPVAIKVLTTEADGSLVNRFRHEAVAVGNLKHKNIVTVYEFGEFQGKQYLAMEYLDGEDLHRVLSSGKRLTLRQKMRIMREVADGLDYAHRHGVVHRDVKPANIMLLSDGNVKIMDFGIARLTRENSTRLTQTGFLVGTLHYMSPEQLNNCEVDPLCDIWAYGVIYYELIAGENPFHARGTAAVMFKVVSSTPPPLSHLVPECPKELDKILGKLLERDRDARYQSFEDVQFDVEPVLAKLQKQEAVELVINATQLCRDGALEQADALIRQAIDLDPGNVEARRLREEVREREGSIRKVRPQVQEVLARANEAVEHRARLYELQAAKEQSEKADSLLAEAKQYLSVKQLPVAFEKATEAQRADPANPGARELVSSIPRAMEVREQGNRLREALHKAKGLVLTKAFDEAIAMLEGLAISHPDSSEVALLVKRTRLEKAEHERKQNLKSGLRRAKELVESGQLPAAIAELEELAGTFPKEYADDELLTKLKHALLSAKVEHEHELEISNGLARVKNLRRTGKLYQALESVKTLLNIYPENPSLLAAHAEIERSIEREEVRRRAEKGSADRSRS